MKQTLTPTEVEIMLVEVPESSTEYAVFERSADNKYNCGYYLQWRRYGFWNFPIRISEKNEYKILGTITKGKPDFDAFEEGLIEGWNSPTGGDDYQDYYKNYAIETPENMMYEFHFTDPDNSFISFLSKEGIPMDRKYVVLKIVKQ